MCKFYLVIVHILKGNYTSTHLIKLTNIVSSLTLKAFKVYVL